MALARSGRRKTARYSAVAVALQLACGPLHAAPGEWVKRVQPVIAPEQAGAVALPVANPAPNRAPNREPEGWAQQDPTQRLVYNVSRPTLSPVADSLSGGQASPAVILVPGGGFQFLAMDNEGYDVARRLVPLGVRVFILKYRTQPVAGGFNAFKAAITATFVRGEGEQERRRIIPLAVADTQAAISMVRARAGEWHVDPAKVGILGFSAGAMTVLATTQANAPGARPDFVGMIYGPTQSSEVPPQAPPLFAAIAADDRFFKGQDLSLIHNWRRSGGSVEFHLFSGGGHGFASHPNGTTSDGWFDEFAAWLKARQIVSAR